MQPSTHNLMPCVCACVRACVRVQVCVCMRACVHVCVHVCMHVCMHVCECGREEEEVDHESMCACTVLYVCWSLRSVYSSSKEVTV